MIYPHVIIYMGKLRHIEAKYLSLGYKGSKQQAMDLNSVSLDSRFTVLTTLLYCLSDQQRIASLEKSVVLPQRKQSPGESHNIFGTKVLHQRTLGTDEKTQVSLDSEIP